MNVFCVLECVRVCVCFVCVARAFQTKTAPKLSQLFENRALRRGYFVLYVCMCG